MSEQQQGGMFGNASPKLTFIFGLILGLAVVSFIGFIVLLVGKFGGENTGTPVAVTQPTREAPLPSAPQEAVGNFRAVDPKTDHIRGDAQAAVTIVEWSDLECPFCKRFHETMRETLDQYKGKVRWVYRHFPLRQLHSKAAKEAEAAECAAELGGNDGFWNYIDRLFAVTPANDGLDPAELPKIAAAVGLNQKKFETCLSSGKYASRVSQDEQDGLSAGVQGTPYSVIVVGDQKIPVSGAVPASELQQILNQVAQ